MRIRTYSEMCRYETLEERFEYLNLAGEVGSETFGFDRWINQHFYRSSEWRQVREFVIVRDNGCDLAVPGYEIYDRPLVHHINPMTPEDLIRNQAWVLDPEYLVTTTRRTHNAIHYGDASLIPKPLVERRPGDTKLW
jgi:hypothetical protein